MYQSKHKQGLEVLGFPANDFAGQEPGTDQEIATFCSTKYDVHFPLFSKIAVKGNSKHPLYRQLTAAKPHAIDEEQMRQGLKGHGIDTGDQAKCYGISRSF